MKWGLVLFKYWAQSQLEFQFVSLLGKKRAFVNIFHHILLLRAVFLSHSLLNIRSKDDIISFHFTNTTLNHLPDHVESCVVEAGFQLQLIATLLKLVHLLKLVFDRLLTDSLLLLLLLDLLLSSSPLDTTFEHVSSITLRSYTKDEK